MSGHQRRVLVVEDERTIAESVAVRLRAEGFTVDLAHDGPIAVARARNGKPDLVVLDIMLPGFDGLEVCRRIQSERPVPVLMLTARGDENDLLVGLAVGADDYLTKPFSMRELAARVHALLRRAGRGSGAESGPEEASIVVGDLEINRSERRVRRAGVEAHLTPTEFDLLKELALADGRPLTHKMLLRKVWGTGYAQEMQLLRTHMGRLRDKLEAQGGPRTSIETLTGVGYRLRG